MKIKFTKNALASTIALSLISASYSGATFAVDYYLCAKQENITMSDGVVVPMWGFAPDSADFADDCSASIQVPGPALTVADTDSVLNIHVRNIGLSEPVSIVIPGQNSTTMVPVMLPSDNTRVRSFTHETDSVATATDGSKDQVYSWTNVKPGTFAYQSGTHPALQVQMGLYGALTKNAAPGQAYANIATTYDSETTVFYSEIDTVLHNQVASGVYGTPAGMTSTMDYNPQYFLVNGDDSSTGAPVVGAPGQDILIRFINMGLKSHMPTLHGNDLVIIAEDGHVYQNPKTQYSVLVAAGQTRDVLFSPQSAGNYTMFDRMLNLTTLTATNGSMPTSPGSLVIILQVGTDSDSDTVLDHLDNCTLIANSDQRDSNGDGFGNICDADLNNDGQVGFSDFSLFRVSFGTTDADADFDGSGQVGFSDFSLFRVMFGKSPGPSGIAN